MPGERKSPMHWPRSSPSLPPPYQIPERFDLAIFQRDLHLGATLARHSTGDHLCAVLQPAFGVEQTGFSGNPLRDHFRIFVDENAQLEPAFPFQM